MLLTGNEIKNRLGTDIIIDPFISSQLNTNSYDLRLGKKILWYGSNRILDVMVENKTKGRSIPSEGMVLYPGELYLCHTEEYTETYNLVPMLSGKSTISRLGICIHITAGFGDIGFKGNWTLEITVVKPVRVYPGIGICQIYYNTILGNYGKGYQGRYQGSSGVVPAKIC